MSKISVTTIAGLTSGGDANTVKIESGDAFNVVSGATTLGGAATISVDLTVDTTTLKVDSSNNRVGIGTITPSRHLHIHEHVGLRVRTHIHRDVCTYMYMYIRMYLCMYAYMYVCVLAYALMLGRMQTCMSVMYIKVHVHASVYVRIPFHMY